MLHLVIGGAASGKSDYAQKLAEGLHRENAAGTLIYLATMSARDDESLERIEKHRRMRDGKGYETEEIAYDISKLCECGYSERSIVLIEDLSNLLAGHAFKKKVPEGCKMQQHADDIIKDIKLLAEKYAEVVAVSNDIASDILTNYDEVTCEYIEKLQYINRELAAYAGSVAEVDCANVLKHTAGQEKKVKLCEENKKMTFVTGGAFSGKTEYVRQNYINKYYVNSLKELTEVSKLMSDTVSHEVSGKELGCGIIVDGLEKIAREAVQKDGKSVKDALAYFENLADKYKDTDSVFVCSENGCGVVPVSENDREFRELCGRVACAFSKRAKRVIRMYCGIAEIIKDGEDK